MGKMRSPADESGGARADEPRASTDDDRGGRRPARRGRRTGRRPAGGDSRTVILHAAREEFAAHGYGAATIASIAGRAGCDPALVHYFFGTKRDLFDAAITLPYDPGAVFLAALQGAGAQDVARSADRGGIGARLVEQILTSWETDENRLIMVALVRSVASEEDAREAVHDLIVRKALLPAVEVLGVPDAERRAVLIGSLLYGLMLVRHVVRVEPVASDSVQRLGEVIGPVWEHYLFDDLET